MNPLVMSIIEDKYIDEEEKLEIEHLSEFKEESLEILEQLEEKLVTLEHAELNDEIVKEVYRSFYSIKGIAGFASQTLIETIAHNTETILSKLQNGLIEFDLVVVEILINSVQLIKQLCKDFSLVKDKKFNEIVKIHLNNLKNFKIKEHKRLEILDDLVLENEEYIKVPLSTFYKSILAFTVILFIAIWVLTTPSFSKLSSMILLEILFIFTGFFLQMLSGNLPVQGPENVEFFL